MFFNKVFENKLENKINNYQNWPLLCIINLYFIAPLLSQMQQMTQLIMVMQIIENCHN